MPIITNNKSSTNILSCSKDDKDDSFSFDLSITVDISLELIKESLLFISFIFLVL